jgi:G:T-mismatch repair DNA endonuclease (very short patch repair protein)
MTKKKTLHEIKEGFKLVHNDLYDYTKFNEYFGTDTKITIICKEHGEFNQTPYKHLKGQGCSKCGKIKTQEKHKDTKDIFINKAKIKHDNKYDYSKVDYKSSNIKVIIICKDHGEFEQMPNNHLQGNGCPNCRLDMMGKWNKSNKDEFISKAIMEHGNRYDYSKVDYKGSKIEITIICTEHGEFSQQPSVHLSGCGCNTCGIITRSLLKKKTQEEFINKAINKNGDKYDYSKVNYTGNNDNIIIICKEHGEFKQTPQTHLSGSGCNKCGKISSSLKQRSTTEDFVSKATIIHDNKFDYSKVNYINTKTKVIIICKIHGDFEQTPTEHLSGCGCYTCGRINTALKQKSSTEEFISKANIIHNNSYVYEKVNYNTAREKVIIICKTHGEFQQIPDSHLRGIGCPNCRPNYSKKQIEWLNLLSKLNNINIQHAMNGIEFTIPSTKYKADGYCENTNTIYEFHGDLWHGNPKLFKPNDTSYFGVKYGKLYKKTLEREKLIKDLGYNLVVMWEYDWNKINKSVKILQRKFRNSKPH